MSEFYPGTKKRISVSKGAVKGETISKSSIKNPSKAYAKFRSDALALCEEHLKNKNITDGERSKILWLRSRVDIEL